MYMLILCNMEFGYSHIGMVEASIPVNGKVNLQHRLIFTDFLLNGMTIILYAKLAPGSFINAFSRWA